MRTLYLAVLLLVISSVTHAGEKYEIKLHRPLRAGGSYSYEAEARQTEAWDIKEGSVLTPQKRTANFQLSGVLRVKEQTPGGDLLRGTLEIKKLTLLETPAVEAEILIPTGWIVSFDRTPPQVSFSSSQGEITPRLSAALAMFFTTCTDDNDDRNFGSTEPRAIGEAWKPDSDKLLKSYEKIGMKVQSIDVEMQAKERTEINKIPCLDIRGRVVGTGYEFPAPQGYTVKSASFTFEVAGLFPIDAELIRMQESSLSTLKASLIDKVNNQRTAEMTWSVHSLKKYIELDRK